MSDEIPADLRYTKEHEWARRDGDLIVVGITAHAVEQLGDITLITVPEPGTAVTQGESFGDIDSVKAVSELFAPVSGEIAERNDELEDAPETVNEDPYGEGWLVKIKPSDPSQLDGLLDAEAYAELVAQG
ncbi:glycine cleavage system protein GcvH [Paraliomyxa miuraensis]|uniref:glycine cleavage system protein GcvH n=1 Tax=Paraliomyxa miuraensis TaxID=376150 RepID=UPI002251764A|nr:glycine cleavage system protein GcvH [Paraliomyxa miuraensis]MCX4245886.1 glycine cleavage system protein GcvH [Paraliomyxa miuraensis]